MYLLDTNIVSELRRARPHGAVVARLESAREKDLHLSAVTIGEIQAGVEITREQDQAKAAEIEAWLEQVAETYNILSMDAPDLPFLGSPRASRAGPPRRDAMIAATATLHGLTVVTRNVRDFDRLGVAAFNPFDGKLG